MICNECETVAHCTKYGCIPERIGKPKPAAQPAQQQGPYSAPVKEMWPVAPKAAAQPAVPDAIGPDEDELPAYAAGWNDCRAAMLEMMK
jgi:hypothetical protein